jgi:hypothetical protein
MAVDRHNSSGVFAGIVIDTRVRKFSSDDPAKVTPPRSILVALGWLDKKIRYFN